MLFEIIIFIVFCILFYFVFSKIFNKSIPIIDINNADDRKLLSYSITDVLFNHIRTFQLLVDIDYDRLIINSNVSCFLAVETIKNDFNINSSNLYEKHEDIFKSLSRDIYNLTFHIINDWVENQHLIKHTLKTKLYNLNLIDNEFKNVLIDELCDYYSKRYVGNDLKYINYFLSSSINSFNIRESEICIEFEKMKNRY